MVSEETARHRHRIPPRDGPVRKDISSMLQEGETGSQKPSHSHSQRARQEVKLPLASHDSPSPSTVLSGFLILPLDSLIQLLLLW